MTPNRPRLARTLALALALGTAAVAVAPAPASSHTQAKPLYQRLGGYDAIAAVVDDFLGRLLADPQLGRFFVGQSQDSKLRIRQLVVDQLCAATGGPCVYIGRDMKTAHAGAGIKEADWTASVGHLLATLAKFKVPQAEQDELIAAVAAMKPDIVDGM
jgi:hemoglobin